MRRSVERAAQTLDEIVEEVGAHQFCHHIQLRGILCGILCNPMSCIVRIRCPALCHAPCALHPMQCNGGKVKAS